MMRSLYSGVTGLRNHQTRMDVIGNNIANVNTVGYKSSRVVFEDIYSQTLATAGGADAGGTFGGTNPIQVGLGMSLATIDVLHTRGAATYTGSPLDLSIEGDGFFTINSGGSEYYTRAGNFYTDNLNNLVTSNGDFVQGYAITDTLTGAYDNSALVDINIPANYYDISINSSGQIVGLNDATDDAEIIGQLVLSEFVNTSGLEKNGANLYSATLNSGAATYDVPSASTGGYLNPGTLEMSNVDLANEFTDMIITQRGFQANSRIITTSDEMLEELVNIKR